jgi:hypothetical protein
MQKDKKTVSTQIPIQFERLEQLDHRFMKIKVWILNIGKNYNGSIFTKDAVKKALPSIALTPILGYIKNDDEGAKDFSDHRIVLEVNDDKGIKEKYLGSAYGVIPENAKAQFELRENEFGGLEEYLTVEGLLWTKFDEAIDIMNRDQVKFQSMELSEKYDGFFNDEGYFVFTDFQFFGCCILGKNFEPAIPQSTVEKIFTTNEITSMINDKLDEYRNKFEKKEDKDVHKKLMTDFGVTAEQLEKAGIKDIEKYDIEEFKEELRKILEEAKNETEKDKQEDQNQNQDQNKEQNQDQDHQNQDQDFDKDGETKNADEQKKSTNEHDKQNHDSKADEKMEEKDKEFNKGTNQENQLDEIQRQMAKLREDYEAIKKDNQSLIDYKKNKEKEEHQRAINSKIAEFDMLLEEDVKEVRENAHNYSVQQAEDKLFAILGRKQSGKEPQNKFAKFYVNQEKEKESTSIAPSYEHYFTKHLKK